MESRNGGRLAIVLPNDPDPNSVTSGVAMELYAKAFGIGADIISGEIIGRLRVLLPSTRSAWPSFLQRGSPLTPNQRGEER